MFPKSSHRQKERRWSREVYDSSASALVGVNDTQLHQTPLFRRFGTHLLRPLDKIEGRLGRGLNGKDPGRTYFFLGVFRCQSGLGHSHSIICRATSARDPNFRSLPDTAPDAASHETRGATSCANSWKTKVRQGQISSAYSLFHVHYHLFFLC